MRAEKFQKNNQKNMKKYTSILMVGVMLITGLNLEARAASTNDIVINEIAWAGSVDASGDEWIELKNNTSSAVDLTGWQINDDETTIYDLSGEIPANGYFLIESHEDAVVGLTADLIVEISLANSGDKLVLLDPSGHEIDIVNVSGSDWPAGDNTAKASMERTDATGNDWNTCVAGNGYTASAGSEVVGTPGGLNSMSESSSGTEVLLEVSDSMPESGDTVTVTASITGVEELFAYGFDIEYDSAVLTYQSVAAGDIFASQTAAFNAELQNGEEGVLVVGEAITQEDRIGVSGDGTLAVFTFLVGESGSADFAFANNFISNSSGDIEANWTVAEMTVAAIAGSASNLVVVEGEDAYSLTLTWDASTDGADYYRVLKLNSSGDYEEIGTTTETTYVDNSDIIPGSTQSYQLVTVLGASESAAITAEGSDSRGLAGDNNRSGRVDGRDLENLAQHYGETSASEGFDQLVDTNYDGVINGSDLIDIGINWAMTY